MKLQDREMRQMIEIRLSRLADTPRLFQIWSDAVDATHDFLKQQDRVEIEPEVRTYVASAPLWLAVIEDDNPVGFMGLSDEHMDSLFIDPAHHRRGVGTALVAHAVADRRVLTTDVNEQNDAAIGFYERMGFKRTGRSAFDQEGRSYPLVHMRLERHNFRAGPLQTGCSPSAATEE